LSKEGNGHRIFLVSKSKCAEGKAKKSYNSKRLDTIFPKLTTNKGDVIEWSDFALINSKDPASYTSTNRCFLIGFPYNKTDDKKVRVNISVNLFQDNGSDLAGDETAKKIKDKLHVNYPALDFEVVTSTGNNGGGGSILITSKPATMSEDEALQLIYDAAIEKGNGKWNFDIDVS